MTDQELLQAHLQDAFAALVAAQKALDAGDMEELAFCLAGAGFELSCALPGEYAEQAPDSWFGARGGDA